jgi:hypothetical protein
MMHECGLMGVYELLKWLWASGLWFAVPLSYA